MFKLADMIGFYAGMIVSLLGNATSLSKAVVAAKDATWKRFFDLLQQQSTHLLQSAGSYPADLTPSRMAQELLARLVSNQCVMLRVDAWVLDV